MKIEWKTHINEKELQEIFQLMQLLDPDATLPCLIDFNEIINRGNLCFLVAICDCKTIGMLSLVYLRLLTGLHALIEDVVVLEEYRRKGAAKKMLETAIQLYQRSGASMLEVTTSPSRMAANQLYNSAGFVPTRAVIRRLWTCP